jgi:hypothetical protein
MVCRRIRCLLIGHDEEIVTEWLVAGLEVRCRDCGARWHRKVPR